MNATFEDVVATAVAKAIAPVLAELKELRVELAALRQAGDPDEVIDVKSVAAMVGKTEAALRRQVERESFPVAPVRIGRALRFRKADIVALTRRGGGQ